MDNYLLYDFDDTYKIDNKEYQINASYDNILKLLELLKDKRLLPAQRVVIALEMLIGNPLEDYTITERVEIINHILDDYVRVEKEMKPDLNIYGEPMPKRKVKPVYDFYHDAKYIDVSFIHAYGMDLFKERGKLHWFRFLTLFESLPSDTMMGRIIDIRTRQPVKGDAEQARVLERLKRQYALPEEDEDLEENIENGVDETNG